MTADPGRSAKSNSLQAVASPASSSAEFPPPQLKPTSNELDASPQSTNEGNAFTPGSSGPNLPPVSLPSGGGAIKGMGENLSMNAAMGMANFIVPLPLSPSRHGTEPSLSLGYDTGGGSNARGMGWSLNGLAHITRSVRNGLPTYDDTSNKDIFNLSGAEDLVPVYVEYAIGSKKTESASFTIQEETRAERFLVRQYRPRIEGLFNRIERYRWFTERSLSSRRRYRHAPVAIDSRSIWPQGRRYCFIIIISQALLAGSVDIAMFITFRLFAGIGCYATAAIVPLMMSELVPPKFRGACVDVMGVGLNMGYSASGWIGYGFSFWAGSGSANAWRVPLAIGVFFPILFIAGIAFLPESPRFLCMVGRENEAEEVLKKLHRQASDPAGDLARAEFFQIRQQIELDKQLENSWYRIFSKPSYRKRAGLAMLTMFTTQTSGVLLITNYAPLIFSTLGLDAHGQLLILALLVTIGIVENALGMLLVDRFPRQQFMAVGMLGCVAAFAAEAGLVAQYAGSGNANALRAGIAMMFVFGVFYSLGVDGPQFCFITEIWPSHLRAKGVSLGVATFSLTNIIWLQAAPTAFANIGWKFYLCLVIPSFFLALVMWFFYPDTRGKPLEEIAAIFGDDDEVVVRQADVEIDTTTHEIMAKGARTGVHVEHTSDVIHDGEK